MVHRVPWGHPQGLCSLGTSVHLVNKVSDRSRSHGLQAGKHTSPGKGLLSAQRTLRPACVPSPVPLRARTAVRRQEPGDAPSWQSGGGAGRVCLHVRVASRACPGLSVSKAWRSRASQRCGPVSQPGAAPSAAWSPAYGRLSPELLSPPHPHPHPHPRTELARASRAGQNLGHGASRGLLPLLPSAPPWTELGGVSRDPKILP